MSSHESERLRQRVAQLLSDIEKEFDNLIDENDALRRKLKQQEGITGGRHSPPRAERARSKSEKRVAETRKMLVGGAEQLISGAGSIFQKTDHWTPSKIYRGHRDGILEVSSCPASPSASSALRTTLIGTASIDRTARIWYSHAPTNFPDLIYLGHKGTVNSIRFHPRDRIVITASGDGTCHIWRLQNFPSKRFFPAHVPSPPVSSTSSTVFSAVATPISSAIASSESHTSHQVTLANTSVVSSYSSPSLSVPSASSAVTMGAGSSAGGNASNVADKPASNLTAALSLRSATVGSLNTEPPQISVASPSNSSLGNQSPRSNSLTSITSGLPPGASAGGLSASTPASASNIASGPSTHAYASSPGALIIPGSSSSSSSSSSHNSNVMPRSSGLQIANQPALSVSPKSPAKLWSPILDKKEASSAKLPSKIRDSSPSASPRDVFSQGMREDLGISDDVLLDPFQSSTDGNDQDQQPFYTTGQGESNTLGNSNNPPQNAPRSVISLHVPLFELSGHQGPVIAADWIGTNTSEPFEEGSPSDLFIASCSWDNSVILWDGLKASAITRKQSVLEGTHTFTNLTSDRNSLHAVTSSTDGIIRVWDLRRTSSAVHSIVAHEGSASSAMYLPSDGTMVFSGGEDRTVKGWDLRNTKQPVHTIRCSASVNKFSISPTNNIIAIPLDDRRTKLCDLTGNRIGNLRSHDKDGHSTMITSTCWSADETVVFSSSVDRSRQLIAWSKDSPTKKKASLL